MAATQYPAQTPEEPSEAAAPASTEPLLLEQSPATSDPDAPIKLNVTTSEPVSLYDRLGPSIVSSDGVRSLSLDEAAADPARVADALQDRELGRDGGGREGQGTEGSWSEEQDSLGGEKGRGGEGGGGQEGGGVRWVGRAAGVTEGANLLRAYAGWD